MNKDEQIRKWSLELSEEREAARTDAEKIQAEIWKLESKHKASKLKEQGVLLVHWGNKVYQAEPRLRDGLSDSDECWDLEVGDEHLGIRACNNRGHWDIFTGVCGRHEGESGDTVDEAAKRLRARLTEYYDGLKELLDD